MTIHLTEAQARELKLRGLQLEPAVSAKPRKKGMARAGGKTRCVAKVWRLLAHVPDRLSADVELGSQVHAAITVGPPPTDGLALLVAQLGIAVRFPDEAGPHPAPNPPQAPANGRRVDAEGCCDLPGGPARVVELLSRGPVNSRNGMDAGMMRWRQDLEILSAVVGLDAVDVVDVLMVCGPSDQPVLVDADVLVRHGPNQHDVAVARDLAARLSGRHIVVGSQPSTSPLGGPVLGSTTVITAATLAGGSRYDDSAVDAGHIHTVIIRVACGEEFTGDAAETRHLNETRHALYETVLE